MTKFYVVSSAVHAYLYIDGGAAILGASDRWKRHPESLLAAGRETLLHIRVRTRPGTTSFRLVGQGDVTIVDVEVDRLSTSSTHLIHLSFVLRGSRHIEIIEKQ